MSIITKTMTQQMSFHSPNIFSLTKKLLTGSVETRDEGCSAELGDNHLNRLITTSLSI